MVIPASVLQKGRAQRLPPPDFGRRREVVSEDFLDKAALWLGQAQEDSETAKELAAPRPYVSCCCARQSAGKALNAVYAVNG